MEEIWQGACNYFDVPTDVAKEWFVRIKTRMSEEKDTRSYNNWYKMMQQKKGHLINLAPLVVLAAFFQYYNYDGGRNLIKENCDAFEHFCREAHFKDEESKTIILKLLDDKTVKDDYASYANQLQDLDLAILAAPEKEYKMYTDLLRREYSHMSDESYKTMRLKVLETLLIIPNIFLTPDFQEKLEATARRNIEKEIDELKQ